MRFSVTCNLDIGGPFWLCGADGELRFISTEPQELTIEELGVARLAHKRLICVQIPEAREVKATAEAVPEPEPPAAEPDEPTEDTAEQAPAPQYLAHKGRRRRR